MPTPQINPYLPSQLPPPTPLHWERPRPKDSHARRQPEGHIRRPRNAFILFRSHCVRTRKDQAKDHREISRAVGREWNAMPASEKAHWEDLARKEKEAHRAMYPNYRYSPMTRNPKDATVKRKYKKPTTQNDQRTSQVITQAPEQELGLEDVAQEMGERDVDGPPQERDSLPNNPSASSTSLLEPKLKTKPKTLIPKSTKLPVNPSSSAIQPLAATRRRSVSTPIKVPSHLQARSQPRNARPAHARSSSSDDYLPRRSSSTGQHPVIPRTTRTSSSRDVGLRPIALPTLLPSTFYSQTDSEPTYTSPLDKGLGSELEVVVARGDRAGGPRGIRELGESERSHSETPSNTPASSTLCSPVSFRSALSFVPTLDISSPSSLPFSSVDKALNHHVNVSPELDLSALALYSPPTSQYHNTFNHKSDDFDYHSFRSLFDRHLAYKDAQYDADARKHAWGFDVTSTDAGYGLGLALARMENGLGISSGLGDEFNLGGPFVTGHADDADVEMDLGGHAGTGYSPLEDVHGHILDFNIDGASGGRSVLYEGPDACAASSSGPSRCLPLVPPPTLSTPNPTGTIISHSDVFGAGEGFSMSLSNSLLFPASTSNSMTNAYSTVIDDLASFVFPPVTPGSSIYTSSLRAHYAFPARSEYVSPLMRPVHIPTYVPSPAFRIGDWVNEPSISAEDNDRDMTSYIAGAGLTMGDDQPAI